MKIVDVKDFQSAGVRWREERGEKKIESFVKMVFREIKERGDRALLKFIRKYDGWNPKTVRSIFLTPSEAKKKIGKISGEVKRAIEIAARRIEKFHRKTLPSSFRIREKGVTLEFRYIPLERVGIYVPGGKASYPSTLLMNAIPARIAGVKEVFVATPGSREMLSPAVVYSALLCEADGIFLMGGAHAIGSFALGTETVPRVDKITGPGNIYVAMAKKEASKYVGIDMFAGPSEIFVLADGSVPAEFVAADLLSQAEHDERAIPVLITTSLSYAKEVLTCLRRMVKESPRREIAEKSISRNGRCILINSIEEGIRMINEFAPEHLSIATAEPDGIIKKCRNAGTIFAGPFTPESLGDYVAGPNHTLPTGGMARFQSPLSSADFVKAVNIVRTDRNALKRLGKFAITLSLCEGLVGHGEAIKVRFK